METKSSKSSRLVLLGLVLLLAISGLNLHIHPVAAAQLVSRSITLSDSTPSATGVNYDVAFTTSAKFESLVIDFCADSPIIGLSTCTAPSGLSVSGASVSFTTGSIGTVSTTGTTQYRLEVAGTSQTSGAGPVAFTVSNVTNPAATGTFYARIYTYSTTSSYSAPNSLGTTVDTGGIALSTANVVQITATVQETLSFCVGKAAPTPNCGGMTNNAPDLTLGSGTPPALNTSSVSTDTAYFQLSTNAQGGANVNMIATNSCANGGLSSGDGSTCSIAGAGGGTGSPLTGLGLVGMHLASSTSGTGNTVTASSPYSGTNYYMDYTSSGGNVVSGYGDTIASTAGPTSNMDSLMTFGASASNTTPAGIYTGGYILVATGAF